MPPNLTPSNCAPALRIDMQRDFLASGGFGASLGNDVAMLRRAIEPTRRVLTAALATSMLVTHTREAYRPDFADLNAAKGERGRPEMRIGDRGPVSRILIRGEPGHDIIPELAPISGERNARGGRHTGKRAGRGRVRVSAQHHALRPHRQRDYAPRGRADRDLM
jgi:nicotinamidase-related amidase